MTLLSMLLFKMMSKFLLQLNERRYQQKKTAKGYQIKPYKWYVIWMVLLLITKEDFNDRKDDKSPFIYTRFIVVVSSDPSMCHQYKLFPLAFLMQSFN